MCLSAAISLLFKKPRHAISYACIMAGVISPAVRTRVFNGESWSTTTSLDWFTLLGFQGDGLEEVDDELDREETVMGLGTAEGWGHEGTVSGKLGGMLVMAMVTARLLLQVGSEEAMDGLV